MIRFTFNTELNYCRACNKKFQFPDVCDDWKCPVCSKALLLKVDINGRYHSCLICKPQELKTGDQVSLDTHFIHEILKIEESNGLFKIALKEYTTVRREANDQIALVTGSWYD